MNFLDVHTTEMHTGGEPVRIFEANYSELKGHTLLEKRTIFREKYDFVRQALMREPRGHHDMYGAAIVQPDHPEADLAVLFMHNEGYSTMCGHAVIALGRYAVDKGMVKHQCPVANVKIQCPCGLVKVQVECHSDGKTGNVKFLSVPAFLYHQGIPQLMIITSPQNSELKRLKFSFASMIYYTHFHNRPENKSSRSKNDHT